MMLLSHRIARKLLLACIIAGPFYRIAMRVLVAMTYLYFHSHEALYSTRRFSRTAGTDRRRMPAGAVGHRACFTGLSQPLVYRPPRPQSRSAILAGCVVVSSYSRIVGLVFSADCQCVRCIPIFLWFYANARGTLAPEMLAWRPVI